MRVAYVIMEFPKTSEAFAAVEIDALRQAGVSVSVHSLRPKGIHHDILTKERNLVDLDMTHITVKTLLAGFWQAVLHPWVAAKLFGFIVWDNKLSFNMMLRSIVLFPRILEVCSEIISRHVDVVHLFWGHYPGMVGIFLKELKYKSILSTFLGAYDLTSGYGLCRRIAKISDVIWTHAKANVPDIKNLGIRSADINICHRGIKLPEEGSFSIERDFDCLVTAGRLIDTKGIDNVIRAFHLIKQYNQRASLVVLGDGPEKQYLIDLVENLGLSESVFFKGHIDHRSVYAELAHSGFFMLMTRHPSERLPNVVKEAMACGCLCVVSNSPGIDELIDDSKTGFVVEVCDYDLASQKIIGMMQDKNSYMNMVQSATQDVYFRFDVNAQVKQYVDKWRSLLM